MQRVDRLVAGERLIDQRDVAFDQPLDRDAHFFLGEPAHFEEARLELLELLLEMPDDAVT